MSKRLLAPLAGALLLAVLVPTSFARAETLEALELRGGAGEPLCLDVAGARAEKGTELILHPCHGRANQSFSYHRDTGELRSALGNLCVDVDKGTASPGTKVQLWTCNGSGAQKFDYDPRHARLSFRAAGGLCVDIRDAEQRASLRGCSGRASQRFELVTRYGKARFDELTFLTAHNAFANPEDSKYVAMNQSRGISRALNDGVRGFMLDVHSFESGTARCAISFGSDCYPRDVYLCHGNCAGVPGVGYGLPRQTLADALRKIVAFLVAHPEELATVILEDYVSRDQLRKVFEQVPGLRDLVFDPYAWNVRQNGWPRASALVHANDRLLVISDRSDKRELGVAFAQDFTVENYWSLGGVSPDYGCRTRWDGVPLDRSEPGFKRLFVMNHYRDVATPVTAALDNRYDVLVDRMHEQCVPGARRKPNFLAVDFYEMGDARGVAAEVNDAVAILYQHGGFSGRAQLLGPGAYVHGDLSVGNDAVSSLQLQPGARVELFEHDAHGGRKLSLVTSQSGLADGFNDLTSSVLVHADTLRILQHQRFDGDFDGDGQSDQLVYHAGTGNLTLGRHDGKTFQWSGFGNARGFGNLLDGRHALFARDFTGDGKTDLMFYYAGDGNIWLGRSVGSAFAWGLASNVSGFGNLLGRSHALYTGDYDGDGKSDLAFYYRGNGDIWFGLSSGGTLSFTRAANAHGLGDLLDDSREVLHGDFDGNGKSDLAFYHAGSGEVWFGLSDGRALSFTRAASIAGFGDLLSHDRRLFVADFDGNGKTDLAFYYAGDGNLWLGRSDGRTLSFGHAGNTSGFGNLLEPSRALRTGDFDGDGKVDILFHYAGNGEHWLGVSSGSAFAFRRVGQSTSFGSLLDPGRLLVTGDFDGDRRSDLLSYSSSDGLFRVARSTGSALDFRDAGGSNLFGDLLR
jgi:hypothetical protein